MISSSFARIERARVDFAAGRLDLLHQRFELGAVAAPGEHREPFQSKLLGDFAADVIPGADHGHGRVSLLQGRSPGQVNSVAFELAPAIAARSFSRPGAAQSLRELVLEYFSTGSRRQRIEDDLQGGGVRHMPVTLTVHEFGLDSEVFSSGEKVH